MSELLNRPRSQLPDPFGRYRMVRLLGRGGMGAVYLAHDTQLDRLVALKIPHFNGENGPRVLERFYREARAAATLDHPNLCPVYDAGQIDGIPYLTMAYIEGRPLSDLIRPGQPLAAPQAVQIVRQLALALLEAHAKGVVHRDLKPANIMINRRGEPVLMDFGLARRATQEDERLTRCGAILGTPAYMAPEQLAGAVENLGPACDIYSLGVVLYELLTGRLPVSAGASEINDSSLKAICSKAMAKKPQERFLTMSELATALSGWLGQTAVPDKKPWEVETVALDPPRLPRPTWFIACAALLAGFVAGGWTVLVRERTYAQIPIPTSQIRPRWTESLKINSPESVSHVPHRPAGN